MKQMIDFRVLEEKKKKQKHFWKNNFEINVKIRTLKGSTFKGATHNTWITWDCNSLLLEANVPRKWYWELLYKIFLVLVIQVQKKMSGNIMICSHLFFFKIWDNKALISHLERLEIIRSSGGKQSELLSYYFH